MVEVLVASTKRSGSSYITQRTSAESASGYLYPRNCDVIPRRRFSVSAYDISSTDSIALRVFDSLA